MVTHWSVPKRGAGNNRYYCYDNNIPWVPFLNGLCILP